MISPAEISNASAGSIVMMSSIAKATTSVSLRRGREGGHCKEHANQRSSEPSAHRRKQVLLHVALPSSGSRVGPVGMSPKGRPEGELAPKRPARRVVQ